MVRVEEAAEPSIDAHKISALNKAANQGVFPLLTIFSMDSFDKTLDQVEIFVFLLKFIDHITDTTLVGHEMQHKFKE